MALQLHKNRPQERRLLVVHRFGSGLIGLALIAFGILGFLDQLAFLSTTGQRVAGLSSNGLLSLLSIVVGLVLAGSAVVGGAVASMVTMVVGGLFLLSGFVNLAWLDTGANFLAFRMSNVIFSFVVGVILLTIGAYGRFSGSLPHDNPYWAHRHPAEVERERAKAAAAHRPPVEIGVAQHVRPPVTFPGRRHHVTGR